VASDSEAEILSILDRTSDRFVARDVGGVLELFAPGDDVRLAGSEVGEVARGRNDIRRVLADLFSRPEAYSFEWDGHDVSVADDVAWVFAEGSLVVHKDDGAVERVPYRMSGVLQHVGERWLWRMFVSSEPLPAQGGDQ
jgi:ketosteroid isomerase-like protein